MLHSAPHVSFFVFVSSKLQARSGEGDADPDANSINAEHEHASHHSLNFIVKNPHLNSEGNMHMMPNQPMLPMAMQHMQLSHGMMPGQGMHPANVQQGPMLIHAHNMPLGMPPPPHAHGQMPPPMGGMMYGMMQMHIPQQNPFPPNMHGFGAAHHQTRKSSLRRHVFCAIFFGCVGTMHGVVCLQAMHAMLVFRPLKCMKYGCGVFWYV